jgi:hypothetical protein
MVMADHELGRAIFKLHASSWPSSSNTAWVLLKTDANKDVGQILVNITREKLLESSANKSSHSLQSSPTVQKEPTKHHPQASQQVITVTQMSDEAERSPSAPHSLNSSSSAKPKDYQHIVQSTDECACADGDLDLPGGSSEELDPGSEDLCDEEEDDGLVVATQALATEEETVGGRGPRRGEDVITDDET